MKYLPFPPPSITAGREVYHPKTNPLPLAVKQWIEKLEYHADDFREVALVFVRYTKKGRYKYRIYSPAGEVFYIHRYIDSPTIHYYFNLDRYNQLLLDNMQQLQKGLTTNAQ